MQRFRSGPITQEVDDFLLVARDRGTGRSRIMVRWPLLLCRRDGTGRRMSFTDKARSYHGTPGRSFSEAQRMTLRCRLN
jgi:hypothetical protein